MLTVKASAKPSAMHGIGLFADQKIKKGTITWKFDAKFDILFDPKEINLMPKIQKEFIMHFSYLSKKTNKYVFSIDDSRFTNHSANNNIDSIEMPGEPELCGVAKKDIAIGEELTVNYRLFDVEDAASKELFK
jgi:uncharacterized protein